MVLDLFDTADNSWPTNLFKKVDFPAFGGPTITAWRNFWFSGAGFAVNPCPNIYLLIIWSECLAVGKSSRDEGSTNRVLGTVYASFK